MIHFKMGGSCVNHVFWGTLLLSHWGMVGITMGITRGTQAAGRTELRWPDFRDFFAQLEFGAQEKQDGTRGW